MSFVSHWKHIAKSFVITYRKRTKIKKMLGSMSVTASLLARKS